MARFHLLLGLEPGDATLDVKLEAAGAAEIAAKGEVEFARRTISCDDCERLWRVFRSLAQAVGSKLTVQVPDTMPGFAPHQRRVSMTAETYAQWARESLASINAGNLPPAAP